VLGKGTSPFRLHARETQQEAGEVIVLGTVWPGAEGRTLLRVLDWAGRGWVAVVSSEDAHPVTHRQCGCPARCSHCGCGEGSV